MGAVENLVAQTLNNFLTTMLARMEMTPESAKAKVLEISNTVLSWDQRLQRIEANQRALMKAADIPYIERVENGIAEIDNGSAGVERKAPG